MTRHPRSLKLVAAGVLLLGLTVFAGCQAINTGYVVGAGGVILKTTNGISDIKTKWDLTPAAFVLQQNYPNPFNPQTTIKFNIPRSGSVTLKVFNVLGKEIGTLINGRLEAGEHQAIFDASNLPSGIYFYSLQTGGIHQTKRMIVQK